VISHIAIPLHCKLGGAWASTYLTVNHFSIERNNMPIGPLGSHSDGSGDRCEGERHVAQSAQEERRQSLDIAAQAQFPRPGE
jgi:hypothetical protein